ncbi:N-acetylmuramoyl-L-alanine amidase domain [Moorella glycerini]|uniref:N-acetylmuramoyl-L-alanine amidase n=1 Tax=Neomoorella stamsii TaxID=1266720 RepID=A0A9X7P530_9FIRM|nr:MULTISPECIES: peptidoglycan recognition family protein [Moorella]PRR69574.1 N-acetylmuramoyl-L-alanine amidase [Moorella stamsii]CEP67902.1 N-acetylmuramoyl-L-alanine amidase domain [Moorella glycerini]CEP68772.1 N-acetylmuramoyl-L-alanine amidase domain [Moorella glycerini]
MTVANVPEAVMMARRSPEDIRYIVIHHSGTPNGNVAIFRDYHIHNKGWADIGYHYVICNGNGGPDGEIQEGRNIFFTGAHASGRNNDSVGICLVGDFIQGKPTSAQMLALYGLIKDLMRRYPITPDRILAHKEVDQTDCPGSLDVGAIRAALSRPPAPEPPTPEPWKELIMEWARDKLKISSDHQADDPAPKWFVLSIAQRTANLAVTQMKEELIRLLNQGGA